MAEETKMAISVDEMAAQLGISRTKAYELVRIPGFPMVRMDRRILVIKDRLPMWLETNIGNSIFGRY